MDIITKDIIVNTLKEKYPYLATHYGLKRIGLFGSYAKGMQQKNSDIDLIAEFERPIGFKFIEFTEYLEKILNHKVDVLTQAGLQSIRLKKIAKNIKDTIVYV